nr:glutathione hydrolase 5 proenzyme [Nothobranchius furzeri]
MILTKCKAFLLLLLALGVFLLVCFIIFKHKKCPGTFSRAAVAADSKKCSEIGRDILKQGGSAVDAAIAALLCTSIINPQSAGIGGGSIFTVMDSSGVVKIINSRETVPLNVPPNLLNMCGSEPLGSEWIGVPGEIRGYEMAHKLYGNLPWANLFQPAIQLAREGFNIPEVLGSNMQSIVGTNKTQALRKLFSNKNGDLLQIGDKVAFPKLADTLEIIANNGADSFYSGKIAKDLICDVQEAGGKLTLKDLASYNVTVTDALAVSLGEYQMYIPPPPAGGVFLALILNIMKGYYYEQPAPLSAGEKVLFYHRYIEALKFTNALKSDLYYSSLSSEQVAKECTTDSFASSIQHKINNNIQALQYSSNLDSLGTTHLSVLAEDGSAVSVTSTINKIFGSKIYSPSTGIILNNQLSDFCQKDKTMLKNISTGERPPSSTAPIVLKAQSNILVIGGSGGSMITTGIASALINHLWFGKSLKEAIDIPVVYVSSSETMIEPIFDKDVITILKSKGHKIGKFYNVVNAVEKMGGCICAVSDARKHGEAAGF